MARREVNAAKNPLRHSRNPPPGSSRRTIARAHGHFFLISARPLRRIDIQKGPDDAIRPPRIQATMFRLYLPVVFHEFYFKNKEKTTPFGVGCRSVRSAVAVYNRLVAAKDQLVHIRMVHRTVNLHTHTPPFPLTDHSIPHCSVKCK